MPSAEDIKLNKKIEYLQDKLDYYKEESRYLDTQIEMLRNDELWEDIKIGKTCLFLYNLWVEIYFIYFELIVWFKLRICKNKTTFESQIND